MLNESDARAALRERLSALTDGEPDPADAAAACAQWRGDPAFRATWHAYHLIGDVLRSEDLAGDPAHDAKFLAAFRSRLALEPVVLAPQPALRETKESRSAEPAPRFPAGAKPRGAFWKTPAAAMAAGVVVVAGAWTLTRTAAPPPGGPVGIELTRTDGAASSVPRVTQSTVAERAGIGANAEPATFIASGQLIRDARLDRYLRAHKQFAGSSALGMPSAFLREATSESTGR